MEPRLTQVKIELRLANDGPTSSPSKAGVTSDWNHSNSDVLT